MSRFGNAGYAADRKGTNMLRVVLCTVFLFASLGGAGKAVAANAAIATDGMTVVDGERVFVLGLYENPEDDEVLRQAAQAGFNLVRAGNSDALDRLDKAGLWSWVNTGYSIDLSENRDARVHELQRLVDTYGKHPALLVWEVPDEALWNCWYGPVTWRTVEEPRQQKEHIDKLEDQALAEELRLEQERVAELWRQGAYVKAETLANEIWKRLGLEPPRPDYGLTQSPSAADRMCAGFIDGYMVLQSKDPAHPIWMNHAPRNQIGQLASFNVAADAVGCDIYPVPQSGLVGHSDIADKSLTSVGAYTDRMQKAAPGKPVWMVLQGFNWADIMQGLKDEQREQLRPPTRSETRFMAYDAIVHGARGILYWGTAYVSKDSEFWDDLLAVVKELSELQPVLSAHHSARRITTTFAQTYGSVDRSIEVLPKDVHGKLWLIVVNEWSGPLAYTLHGLDGQDGVRYRAVGGGEEAVVSGGTLTLTLPGFSVHVLEPV